MKHAAGETPALSRVRTGSGSAGRCGVVAALCLFPSEIPQILLSVVRTAQAGKFLKGSRHLFLQVTSTRGKKGLIKSYRGQAVVWASPASVGLLLKLGLPQGSFLTEAAFMRNARY